MLRLLLQHDCNMGKSADFPTFHQAIEIVRNNLAFGPIGENRSISAA